MREQWTAHPLYPLLMRHLLSCLSLPLPGQQGPNQWIPLLNELLPGYDPEILVTRRWLTMPIPALSRSRALVRWYLATLLPGPDRTDLQAAHLADESRLAIHRVRQALDAANLPVTGTLILLALQDAQDPPLTGTSLGLPLALALLLLSQGRSWPAGLYASGRVEQDGNIHPVNGLRQKRAAATDLRCFLQPEDGLPTTMLPSGCLALSTLKEAAIVLDGLAHHLNPASIAGYRQCLHSIDQLLLNFATLPGAFFTLPATRNLLADLNNDPAQHLQQLAPLLWHCRHQVERAALLADLFTPDQLRQVANHRPELRFPAFSWALARMALANHSGNGTDSATWHHVAQDLLQETGSEQMLDLVNHALVRERFNRYHFQPNLPQDLMALLDLEQQAQRIRPRADRHLGALYGTMAQNCGFCGPSYFQDLLTLADRAETTFGNRYHEQKRRLDVYRCYGALDAHQFDLARFHLNRVLGLDRKAGTAEWSAAVLARLDRPEDEGSPYAIALACRTLAELAHQECTPSLLRGLTPLVHTLNTRAQHPWQLTALNLARLHQQPGMLSLAETLLETSRTICSRGGETMQAMALLPLALLWQWQLARPHHLEATVHLLDRIRQSRFLDQTHFAPLLARPGPELALEELISRCSRYFPFSYR